MDKRIKNLLGIVGSILMVSLLVLALSEIDLRLSGPGDISKRPTVTMSAEGKVSAKPDTATVNFTVVTTGKKAEDVQKENDKRMKNVIDFLKSNGLAETDIQTSNYSLYPQYNYQPDKTEPEITGYNLNQTVSVKIRNLEKVPIVTSGLTGKGINQIDSLYFFIDDPDKLKSQAREQAVEKARAKARDLAHNLGVRLGRVVNFSEGDFYIPPPVPYAADARGFGEGGSPIQPGTQDVTVSVNLTFELR